MMRRTEVTLRFLVDWDDEQDEGLNEPRDWLYDDALNAQFGEGLFYVIAASQQEITNKEMDAAELVKRMQGK